MGWGREELLLSSPLALFPLTPLPPFHSPSPWGAHIHPQMRVGWMMDGWG